MIHTLIITGGKINNSFLEHYFKKNSVQYIIAVDKGLESLEMINLSPTHIIGDFDSVNDIVLKKYDTVPVIQLNPEKDYTDTHMGLKLAIELKSTDITIIRCNWFKNRSYSCKYTNIKRSFRQKYTL